VSYAAIRAEDLPEYLEHGMVSTPAMRELTFTFRERWFWCRWKWSMLEIDGGHHALPVHHGGSPGRVHDWHKTSIAYLGAVFTGSVFGPLLLPGFREGVFRQGRHCRTGLERHLVWLAGGSTWSAPTTIATFLALPR